MDTPNDTISRLIAGAVLSLLCVCLAGCASWSNPVANGIPVRLLPQELLAEPKDGLETIPLTLLRQKPPGVYRLAPGDLLGIYIEGVLGQEDQLPPVNFPESPDLPPSVGYPILVREDGTLPLPLVDPVHVEGLTVGEAEQAVKKAYTVDKEVLLTGEERILVTMIRPRQTRVLVIRQDSPGGGVEVQTGGFRGIRGGNTVRTGRVRGTGAVVDLLAYENDVLTALARTGGLPGTDAINEVVIERGYADGSRGANSLTAQFQALAPNYQPRPGGSTGREVVRIPLRLPPGQQPPFTPEDIILHDGDILFIEAREAEVYYTAGILPNLEVPLPRDYDLNVIEAVARVGGPLLNGAVNSNNLQGNLIQPGIGNPSPSLLAVVRQTEDGRQITIRVDLNRAMRDPRENIVVKSGDLLVLQETPREAFARYLRTVFNFGLFSDVISRTDTTGTTSLSVP